MEIMHTNGVWVWATGTEGVEPWLVHLPSGNTISISDYQHPGPAIALEWDGGKTYMYYAKDIEDARVWLVELARALGALDIRKNRTLKADKALALEIVRKHFPDAKQVFAEIYCDPEIDDSYPIIYVRMEEYDDNFLGRLKAAKKEVWEAMEGWVSVTTDYR